MLYKLVVSMGARLMLEGNGLIAGSLMQSPALISVNPFHIPRIGAMIAWALALYCIIFLKII